MLAKEIESLPKGHLIVEGQNVDQQIERCFDASPDMTVCGLGLANPLEAKGMTTKWSIELVFTPIHGFDQVGDLLNIFAKPILRNQQLNFKVDAERRLFMKLTLWTYEGPPCWGNENCNSNEGPSLCSACASRRYLCRLTLYND